MSTARFTVPKQRLAQLLRTPGGPPAAEALAAARDNLAELRPQCIGELKDLLEAAEKTYARLQGYEEAGLAELYEAAVRGVGLGDLCGAGSVDVALHSLCDLLDHLQTQAIYDSEAVGVHLRAWRLLISTELPADGAQKVLDGLNRVSAKFGVPKNEDA
jgi:hypothetical protein